VTFAADESIRSAILQLLQQPLASLFGALRTPYVYGYFSLSVITRSQQPVSRVVVRSPVILQVHFRSSDPHF